MAGINTSGASQTRAKTATNGAAGTRGAAGTQSGVAPQRPDNSASSTPTDKVSLGSGPTSDMQKMKSLRNIARGGGFGPNSDFRNQQRDSDQSDIWSASDGAIREETSSKFDEGARKRALEGRSEDIHAKIEQLMKL